MGILERRIGGSKELTEKWERAGGAQPKGSWEREVDFFKTTVGGVCYRCCKAWGEARVEGCKITFEPAEGSRYDDFVKGFGDLRRRTGGCYGYLGILTLELVVVERRGFCGEAELSFCERSAGNSGEYGPVGARNEEVFYYF